MIEEVCALDPVLDCVEWGVHDSVPAQDVKPIAPCSPQSQEQRMKEVRCIVNINVSLPIVFQQWTRFEDYPKFMQGIEKVVRLDDKTLRWKSVLGGHTNIWDAEITEIIPNRHLAWQSITGSRNSGTVTFEENPSGGTKVIVHMFYEPKGIIEFMGDCFGVVQKFIDESLVCFQRYMELRRKAADTRWQGSANHHGFFPHDQR